MERVVANSAPLRVHSVVYRCCLRVRARQFRASDEKQPPSHKSVKSRDNAKDSSYRSDSIFGSLCNPIKG